LLCSVFFVSYFMNQVVIVLLVVSREDARCDADADAAAALAGSGGDDDGDDDDSHDACDARAARRLIVFGLASGVPQARAAARNEPHDRSRH
jgi:hypothetical protein